MTRALQDTLGEIALSSSLADTTSGLSCETSSTNTSEAVTSASDSSQHLIQELTPFLSQYLKVLGRLLAWI